MSRSLPSLFVAGMPGCGKSYFGRWLATTHGYRHLDLERDDDGILGQMSAEMACFQARRDPMPLVDRLQADGRPLMLNWGFPLSWLDVAAKLSTRLLPVWFFASIEQARESFLVRGDVSLSAFERQMADINRHGFALDSTFGAFNVRTISDEGVRKPCGEIFGEILKFQGGEPGATDNPGDAQ